MPTNKVSDAGEADVEQGNGDLNPAPLDPATFSATADPSDPEGGEKPPMKGAVVQFEVEGGVDKSKPYAGMGKADLLKFSDTPFWNRFRLISILIFWGVWLALLVTVVALTIVAPRCGDRPTPAWWQKSVVYQIYVRSFYDTNDDGKGDLNGVRAKMDYLKELKVDAILLSSIYQSKPDTQGLADYGYEITNHTAIDSDYVSSPANAMAEFETLVEAAHNNSIAVILDFIPNHTGLDHRWFTTRGSPDDISDPYWNYYVTAPCPAGPNPPEPNNWYSVYGQRAWTRDTTALRTDLCYLHQFLATQPELNLRSTGVQRELEEILKFWLDKGVDGFRVNSAAYLFEDSDLSDDDDAIPNCPAASNPYDCLTHAKTKSQPETYDLLKRWRDFLDVYSANHPTDKRQRVLLTDADVELSSALLYYGLRWSDGAHLPVNYQLIDDSRMIGTSANPGSLVMSWLNGMPYNTTAAWLTGDQDRPRLFSYAGADYINAMHMLKLTLPGTALVYNGDEIGMKNYAGGPNRDPAGQIESVFNRDPYRTPMHWGVGPNANFSDSTTGTWLNIDPDYATLNVQLQNDTSNSTLSLFKSLTKLRADKESLQYGAMHYVNTSSIAPTVISYVREHEGFDRLLVAINFGAAEATFNLRQAGSTIKLPGSAEIVLTTHSEGMMKKNVEDWFNLKDVKLYAGEGFIAKWEYKRE